jgi:hypothetical protein
METAPPIMLDYAQDIRQSVRADHRDRSSFAELFARWATGDADYWHAIVVILVPTSFGGGRFRRGAVIGPSTVEGPDLPLMDFFVSHREQRQLATRELRQ